MGLVGSGLDQVGLWVGSGGFVGFGGIGLVGWVQSFLSRYSFPVISR